MQTTKSSAKSIIRDIDNRIWYTSVRMQLEYSSGKLASGSNLPALCPDAPAACCCDSTHTYPHPAFPQQHQLTPCHCAVHQSVHAHWHNRVPGVVATNQLRDRRSNRRHFSRVARQVVVGGMRLLADRRLATSHGNAMRAALALASRCRRCSQVPLHNRFGDGKANVAQQTDGGSL